MWGARLRGGGLERVVEVVGVSSFASALLSLHIWRRKQAKALYSMLCYFRRGIFRHVGLALKHVGCKVLRQQVYQLPCLNTSIIPDQGERNLENIISRHQAEMKFEYSSCEVARQNTLTSATKLLPSFAGDTEPFIAYRPAENRSKAILRSQNGAWSRAQLLHSVRGRSARQLRLGSLQGL